MAESSVLTVAKSSDDSCESVKVLWSFNRTSSSNLKSHLLAKNPDKVDGMEITPQKNKSSPIVMKKRKIVSSETAQEDVPSLKKIKLETHIVFDEENQIFALWDTTEKEIVENFRGIKYVATTADCWSYCGKREFVGITAHWIDPENFERCHAVLACKWKQGNYSPKELTDVLNATFERYGIVYKNVGLTLDSGSNFATDFGTVDPEQEVIDEDVKFIELAPIFALDLFESNLPPHSQCVIHILNLIATNDIPNALLSAGKCKKLYDSTLTKCQSLWTKHKELDWAEELTRNIVGFGLELPNSRNWKSIFDAMGQIKDIGREQLNFCMDALGLKTFKKAEIKFLKEYVEVIKTILAIPVETIQLENTMHRGCLLPLLYQMKKNCEQLKASDYLRYCSPLVDCVLTALEERFAPIWTEHDHMIASCVHPKFKMDWLSDETDKWRVKEYILYEMTRKHEVQNACTSREESFFTFFGPDPQRLELEGILDDFFEDPEQDLSIFHNTKYDRVKDIFLQYNTQIPTGAGIRRTFDRDSISTWDHDWDTDTFEKQLLLELNVEHDHL